MSTFGVRRPTDVELACKDAARKALAIDASLAEAHTTLGFAEAVFDWKWADAERRLRHALTLNPGDTTTRHYLGLLLLALGRSQEAIAELRHAFHVDPLSPNIGSSLGWVYGWSGDTTQAIDQLQATLRLDPNLPTARLEPLRPRRYHQLLSKIGLGRPPASTGTAVSG